MANTEKGFNRKIEILTGLELKVFENISIKYIFKRPLSFVDYVAFIIFH